VDGQVIEGRECGSCNACCVALTIEDPALYKVQGYRCPNLNGENGCGIYPTRPHTCRIFECGWRLLKFVKPTMRPDKSDVLIRIRSGADGMGIVVSLLSRAALKAEGLAETVAAAVAAGRPVFLDVPGPPGHTSAVGRIDEVLADAVAARDKAGILEILRQARRQGRSGPTVPIRAKLVKPDSDSPGEPSPG
jgi:hypothetical protein